MILPTTLTGSGFSLCDYGDFYIFQSFLQVTLNLMSHAIETVVSIILSVGCSFCSLKKYCFEKNLNH